MYASNNNGDKAKKFNTLVELEETASERRAHRPGAVTARNIDDSYIVGIILARYSTDNVFRTEPNVNLRVTDPEFFHAPQGETSSPSYSPPDITNTAYTLHENKGWKLTAFQYSPAKRMKAKSADEYLGFNVDDLEVKRMMDMFDNIIGHGERMTGRTSAEEPSVALEKELDDVDAHFKVPENMQFRKAPAVCRISGEIVEHTYRIHPRKLRQTSANCGASGDCEASPNYPVSGARLVVHRPAPLFYKRATISYQHRIMKKGHDHDGDSED